MERSVPDPDRMKIPMTDTYVTRHSAQTVFSTTNEAYAKYITNARPMTDHAKRYKRRVIGKARRTLAAGADALPSPRALPSRQPPTRLTQPATPASASIVAPRNQMRPPMATGTP